MNHCIIIGNLVRDPELRTTNSGIHTCTFTVAVNRPRQKDGTQQADYIPVVTWRSLAENCAKYLGKGRKCAVEGEIRTRNYEKDGRKVCVTELAAHNVEFLTPRDSAAQEPYGTPQSSPMEAGGFTEVDDDELPF